MFICKLHTKLPKSISQNPSTILLQNSSPFSSNHSTKNSHLLQFFFLHSKCIHHLTRFRSSHSRNRSVLTTVTGHFSYACQLLDKMPHRKMQALHYTLLRDVFKLITYVSDKNPSITNATVLHAFALKHGSVSDLGCVTSLLTVYSKAKEFDYSAALFSEVVEKDLVLWNAMMSACVTNNRVEAALCLFNRMLSEGTEFSFTTLVIMSSAFSDSKCVRHGGVIHGLSIKTGMIRDVVLGNAFIDMYAKCGHLSSAECLFAEVKCKDLVTWNSVIVGCLYNGYQQKSLRYFRCRALCGFEADGVSISCALAACTGLQNVDVGVAIHGLAIKLGYGERSHVSVANSLISFYSQIRDMDAAECVFRSMIKNLVSWNAMIKGFLSNGKVRKAFALLREMQLEVSVQPDMATAVTIIPFCAEHMLIREGKAIHGFTIHREMALEVSVINSLINLYCKCNNMKNAEYLFFNMLEKDLISWNTMIAGYAQNRHSHKAQAVFKQMMEQCAVYTLPTMLAVIQSCDSPDSLQLGKLIHSWHVKSGFLNHIFAVNSLIHMYSTCGALSDALTLFTRVYNRADLASWNTIIAGCTQKCDYWKALEYFDLMRKVSHCRWDSITLETVISSCGNLSLVTQGKLVHGLAFKTWASTDIQVQNSLVTMYGRLGDTESAKLAFNLSNDNNLCSWNCGIPSLSQNEDAKKALELFRSLDFEPNEITISTVLSACMQLGDLNYGKQLHGHVFRFGFHADPVISAALLDMYSNCGTLGTAERVFLSSPKKSVVAWNSLISAYGYHNFGTKAIETFMEMIKSGSFPTKHTFTSLLSACSHSGLVDEGRACYDQMVHNFKVPASVEHHVCMVDILGRSGRLNEAYDFIKKLPTKAEAPVWGALLSACGYHGDLEMGREVADIIFSVEPGNVSYYVSLCNMYVAAGRWEEAVELRNLIQDKQPTKPAGYSLIDPGPR